MIKKLLALLVCISCWVSVSGQQIQSPSAFLGYELGSRFTTHDRIVAYFKYVAEASKQTHYVQYGTTREGRPLIAMYIASAANINRLDDIRKNNLALAGLEEDKAIGQGFTKTVSTPAKVIANTPVIVWLSYNVHGNEPASSEAAMQALFDMVDPANTKTKAWLENTVVVIDPCLNPDGRERYVNFYNSVKGVEPDANPAAREHAEPWPGGRSNHYYFDLNRDWAWQTQKESQMRVGLFDSWLPQVHVDFHEQSYNAPYYFAPAAEPFHKDITLWQKEFQTIIGKNNAKYFDQNGWLYFTKEEFDLLYPSYGDTYPIYNGSVGMTYEQGGIGAGLAIKTLTGELLTLKDRIAHHHSNSLSTVEAASANATKAVAEFKKYFDNSRTNPNGEYKGYIIKNYNDDKTRSLARLLKNNDIQYQFGTKAVARGYNYFTGKTEQVDVEPGDIVISAYQPKSVLLHVLFEPKTFLADSNTYDITAWSLPYVYGLKTYGLKEAIKTTSAKTLADLVLPPPVQPPAGTALHAYAYVAAWKSVTNVKFLSELLKNNIKVRYAESPFEAGGKKFAAGSLIIPRAGNADQGFDNLLLATAYNTQVELTPLTSGFVDKGVDLGSTSIHYIRAPKVMLVSGEGANSAAMGEIWHYFEQEIGYPVTLVNYDRINRVKLSDFDEIIFPDGDYDDLPTDKLRDWVSDGGKLIMLQDAVGQLAGKKGFDIKKKEVDSAKIKPSARLYGERNRDAIKNTVPGAIYKINLDNTHPLGFGYPNYYYTLKLSEDIYNLLEDGNWNVGTIKKDGYVAGFVGEKSKDKIKNGLLLGVQSIGRGSVIYMVDDPLFRSFWENGKLLFGNAVFMTP